MPYHIVWQVQLHTGEPPTREFLADFIAHPHVISVEKARYPSTVFVTMHHEFNTPPEDIAQDPNIAYSSHLELREGHVRVRVDDRDLYDAVYPTLVSGQGLTGDEVEPNAATASRYDLLSEDD